MYAAAFRAFDMQTCAHIGNHLAVYAIAREGVIAT